MSHLSIFVDLFVFSPTSLRHGFSCLVGAPQAMCESTTIKVGLSCLVRGPVGVEPRPQGRKIPEKTIQIPYNKRH